MSAAVARFTGSEEGGADWTIEGGNTIVGQHKTAHGVGRLEVAKLGVAVHLGPQLTIGLHPFESTANARLIAAAPKLYAAARDTYRGAFAALAKEERSGTAPGITWQQLWEILEAHESALARALTLAEPGACNACRGTGRTVTLSGCADGEADYDSEPCYDCDGTGDQVLR